MNFTRRNFLSTTALALVGAAANALPEAKKAKHIGVQLYSVRADMKKDPLGTLQKLAAMGYREVEHADYGKRKFYGYSAPEFKKVLDDLDLKMTSGHVVFGKNHWNEAQKTVTDDWKYAVEDAAVVGQKYLISPWFPWDKKNLDEVKKGLEAWNYAGKASAEGGVRFGFHNHDEEFKVKYEGEYLYDIMLKGTDLKYVCQQLDICNMSAANVDPMIWLKKFPKYFELLHVKDLDKNKPESTLLGDGRLDTKGILDYARKHTPIQYWVIEQESYGDKTPLECVQIDLERLKGRFGFA